MNGCAEMPKHSVKTNAVHAQHERPQVPERVGCPQGRGSFPDCPPVEAKRRSRYRGPVKLGDHFTGVPIWKKTKTPLRPLFTL